MGFKQNRLPPREYHDLCQRVFERDKWKCRVCGRRDTLHAHHVIYRSKGGLDAENNLVTLCFGCHQKVHEGKIKNEFR